MKPITNIDDPRYVKAMSHPLRVRILALLDERPASPVELSGWLGSTLGTTAYHVRTLERLGLIELMAESRVRGAVEHHYRARERPSVSDEAWAAAPAIAKQAAVSASLETIDAYTHAASAAGGFDHDDAHLSRSALHLDDRGFKDISSACLQILAQVDRIEESARERIERDPHAAVTKDIALVMMLFEAARVTAEHPDDPPSATNHHQEPGAGDQGRS